jgi:hypothetical protein
MTIFINKEGKSGLWSRVKISALPLHRQIGGIDAIVADTNKLGEMPCLGVKNYG